MMHISEADLLTTATSLVLCGSLVGLYGAWHAWNRVAENFTNWRNSIESDVKLALSTYRADKYGRAFASPQLGGQGQLSGATEVIMPGTDSDRIQKLETRVAKLPGEIAEDIEAALVSAFATNNARENVFKVKDTWWALLGFGIVVLGTVLLLLDQLSVFSK
jgi:hypothetical protein